MVPVRVEDQAWRWTLLDLGSPVTLVPIDASTTPGTQSAPLESIATVAILEADSVAAEPADVVTRFEFQDQLVYGYEGGTLPLGTAEPVAGLLGTDLLGRFALELRMGSKSLTLFDTIDGTNAELALDGWAVFTSVLKGGGRTESGCASPLPGRRLVVRACAFEEGDQVGTDLTLAVATNVVNLTIGGEAGAPRFESLARLAIVGDSDDELGPCEEVIERLEGRAGAATVWVDGDIAVDGIADSDPGLIAARAEVGNSTDGLDGFLGTAMLAQLRVRVDYPSRRLLLRCEAEGTCHTAPRSLE